MARKPKISSKETIMQVEITEPASIEQAASEGYHRSRCGGALRQAREEQGLSVQDVASKLRLSPKQIEAIEADHFAKLPEPTIVRGFIRNYAKLLKINSEPLLDAYTVIVPSNTQHQLTVKPSTNMQVTSGDKPKVSSYIWAGLLALLALGAWLFYQSYIEKPSPTKPSANSESSSIETLESLPQPALPAAERAPEPGAPLQPSTEITLPPANVDATTTTLSAPTTELAVPATSNVIVVETPLASAATLPAPIAALPTTQQESAPAPAEIAKLEFNATQETWVSVTDANGKQIYDKIIFAGSREVVQGKPPLSVVVGNAGATSLNMNGKAIQLAPHSRNNVARIKLE
jgi:cytoskeleton protein RodZ